LPMHFNGEANNAVGHWIALAADHVVVPKALHASLCPLCSLWWIFFLLVFAPRYTGSWRAARPRGPWKYSRIHGWSSCR
jgi:hypothetical protein